MAIPSLAMIPSGYKDGKVYSVLPSNGDGDFTFSRGSNATRVNKDGLIETMPLELGSELITNGGFDTDSDWNKATGITISGGSANFTGVSGQYLNQNINFVSGKVYEITFNVLSGSGALTVFLGGGNNVSPSSYVVGENKIIATGGGSDSIIYLGSAFTGSIDNVSVKEVLSGYDLPRLDYSDSSCPSLLLEPQSTNLVSYSEDFTNSSWGKLSGGIGSTPILDFGYASPDGTSKATKVTLDKGNSSDLSDFSMLKFEVTEFDGVGSIYLKGDSGGEDITLFTRGAESVVVTLTTEWQRYDISSTQSTQLSLRLRGSDNTNDVATFYAWGAQLEEGSYATSYIPTQGSAVTRLADVCNNGGNEQVFNDSEGVLIAEISALDSNVGTERYVYIGDGTNTNRLVIRYSPTENDIRMLVSSGGSTQVSLGTTNYNVEESHKIALKYKVNDFALWIDGVEVLTDTSGSTPIGLSELTFSITGAEFYGYMKQLQYFDKALTDIELKALTT